MVYNLSGQLKRIKVNFGHDVDISHFNQNAYNQVRTQGFFLNEISLIHYASIHYQSKFHNSLSRRFKYTLDTIEPAIIHGSSDSFIFSGTEESELQRITSEVIGVGFSVGLMHRLLDVKLNAINKLPEAGSMKRCDYEILKNNSRIIFESKGRKYDIEGAKKEILSQKSNYTHCVKYGIISHIPRDNTPSQLFVIDPEEEPSKIDKHYMIISLLNHYSKGARLAGFYRLSEKLNDRLYAIGLVENDTDRFKGKSLEYKNIFKIGKTLQITVDNLSFQSFFAPDLQNGLKATLEDNSMLIFGMDKNLIRLLESQDYDQLLEYKHKNIIYHKYSVLDNGTFLMREQKDKIMDIIKA